MTRTEETHHDSLTAVRRAYADAVKTWRELNRDEDTPEFWCLDLHIDDELLRSAALEVVDAIRFRRINHETTAQCLVLFHVLRTRLSNAQANKLWPIVAEGLESLTGISLPGGDVGAHFRQCLEVKFPDQLNRVRHFFRFVYLCFAESGAGKDRARLIKEFFGQLVERYPGGLNGHERIEFCDAFLTDYIEGAEEGKTDIAALAGLMERSGYELLSLADELRARPELVSLRQWDWSRLRKFWAEKTGVDLERLLPEARDVFLEMLPSIASVVTRSELRKLIAESSVKALLPPSVSEPDAADPSTIPVGPALLETADAERSEVYVREDSGLDANDILSRTEARWHEVCRRYLIWRRSKFSIRASLWTTDAAAPLFANRSFDSNARPVAWFWVSERNPSYAPEDLESGARPSIRTAFKVIYRWRYVDQSLICRIERIRLSHVRNAKVCSLVVNDNAFWSGDLQSESWRSIERNYLLPSPTADVVVQLKDHDTIVDLQTFRSPVRNGSALFLGSICKTDVSVAKDQVERLRLMTDRAVAYPKASGLKISRIRDEASDTPVYGFRLSDDAANEIWISSGAQRWNIRVGPFAAIVPEMPAALSYEGVDVVPTGNVHVASTEFHLQIHIPDGWSGLRNASNSLEVVSGYRTLVIPLNELLNVRNGSASVKLDLFRILKERRFEPAFGLMRIRMRGPTVESSQKVSVFVLRGSIKRRPCAFDEYATLDFIGLAGPHASLRSMRPTAFNEQTGEALASRALLPLGDHEELRFSWRPLIRDVLLRRGGQSLRDSKVSLFASEEPIELINLDRNGASLEVRIDDVPCSLQGEKINDIVEFLAQSSSVTEQVDTSVVLTVADTRSGCTIREWEIDCTPSASEPKVAWMQDVSVGATALTVRSQIRSLPTQTINFALITQSREIVGAREFLASSIESDTVSVPYHGLSNDGLLELVISCSGIELARCRAPDLPEIDSDAAMLEKKIQAIVDERVQNENHVLQMLRLYDRYIAEFGRVPWPANKLCRQISGAGASEVNGLATIGITLLYSFASGREVDVAYGVRLGNGTLDLFLATLALGEQLRLHARGHMIPGQVDQCVAVFRTCAREPGLRDWAVSMEGVANRLGGLEDAQIDLAVIEACQPALDSPLVRSDGLLLSAVKNLGERK